MSQNHGQRGLVRENVEQPAADDDGVTDGEGFQPEKSAERGSERPTADRCYWSLKDY